MKKVLVVTVVLALLCTGVMAQAYVWDFSNSADYYFSGSASSVSNTGYVASWTADEAAVFAKINTQAYHLKVGDITGGGFTLSGMNHQDAVYGSLYLSPTGGGGSTVMINMSPMGRTGADGAFVYTFGLDTLADVKIKNGSDGSWGTALTTGTFGGAIDYINGSAYSGTYAAFFGPQIGMSGTSETTFTVSRIEVAVPEPSTLLLLGSGLLGLVVAGRKKFRK